MLYQTSSHQLFSDAFFVKNGRLLFASLYGRDADILAFLATITNNQLHDFRFKSHDGNHVSAHFFTNLNKRMTKYPTRSYGLLTHIFLYAEDLTAVDLNNQSAWIVLRDTHADMNLALERCVRYLSKIPLLEHWLPFLVSNLERDEHIVQYPSGASGLNGLVGIRASSINLPSEFATNVSEWIKSGNLLPA